MSSWFLGKPLWAHSSHNRSGIDFTAKVPTFEPARSAWEPVEIAEQLGMDNWNTFEKNHLEINLYLEVLFSIFEKIMVFQLPHSQDHADAAGGTIHHSFRKTKEKSKNVR